MATRFPPGPQDYFFGFRTAARMKSDVLGTYQWLQREYGDAVSFRTGPYRLFIFFHPEQVREVLVTRSKSIIRFPRVMQTFAQWNGNSILIAEGEQWIRQRRLVAPAFQPRRLEGYGKAMVASARRLADRWRRDVCAAGYMSVDIDRAMTELTLDIICRTMFDDQPHENFDEINQAVSTLSQVAFHEMQAPVRWPLWLPTQFNRKKRQAMELLDKIVWQFVRQRRAEGQDRGDLLSMLLNAVDEKAGGGRLDDQQVRNEAMTLMLAGHDTTAAAMNWLWFNLAQYPEVAERCREEIESVVGERDPAAGDVDQLAFLHATVKETLRMYPPAIGVFLRQTTADVQIGGYDVPRGNLVTLSSFNTHHDPRWFPEPEQFDPHRFLPPREETIPPGAYFPFGAGPRVCIGESFATAEMILVTATLLREFDVALAPGTDHPGLKVVMALRPEEPLVLRFTPR